MILQNFKKIYEDFFNQFHQLLNKSKVIQDKLQIIDLPELPKSCPIISKTLKVKLPPSVNPKLSSKNEFFSLEEMEFIGDNNNNQTNVIEKNEFSMNSNNNVSQSTIFAEKKTPITQNIIMDDFIDYSKSQPLSSTSSSNIPTKGTIDKQSSSNHNIPEINSVKTNIIQLPQNNKSSNLSKQNTFKKEKALSAEEKLQNIAQNEKHLQILKKLLSLPENKHCADCGRLDPSWASVNLGIFICLNCSGIHRSLGTHITKVRSCTLDTWTPEQIEFIQTMGNAKAKLIYEANLPPGYKIPNENDSQNTVRKWIISKYEDKEFIIKNRPIPTLDNFKFINDGENLIHSNNNNNNNINDDNSEKNPLYDLLLF
jgi:hypothetical protein